MALGVVSTAAIASLDHKVIARARDILTVGGISCALIWRGYKKEHGNVGFCGALGLIWTGIMVYHTFQDLTYSSAQGLSLQQCKSFVDSHKDELNQICKTKAEIGDWKRIGAGGSKIAFTHPEFPQAIIKIPKDSFSRFTAADLQAHFSNIEHAKNIVSENRYQYIALPDSHLVEMDKGNVLCETKFEFRDRISYIDCWINAKIELYDFLQKSGFCDINLFGHNAQFLKGSCNIGIYDFDWQAC